MLFKELVTERYPKTFALPDGTPFVARPLVETDQRALLEFFRRLPDNDRLLLRDDVTNEPMVARWCQELDYDRVFPLVALVDEQIVADATLHLKRGGWMRHIGRLRVVVDPAFRAQGIASTLLRELMEAGLDIGLHKLEAEFIAEQTGAMKTLQKLGFVKVTTLPEHALDLHGRSHDLVLMAYKLKDEEYYAGDQSAPRAGLS